MEARRLQLRFLQRLHNHLIYPVDIRTIDIEYYLTVAQERYIDSTYQRFKGEEALRKRLAGVYKESLLGEEYRVEDEDRSFRGGEVWFLPDEVRYVLDEYVIIEGIPRFIPVKPVDASYVNKQENNPFKKPYNKLFWRLDRGYIEIDGGGFTTNNLLHELVKTREEEEIKKYGIVYIKTPQPVKLTTDTPYGLEVSPEFQDEILDLAIEFAIQTLSLAGRLKSDEEMNQPN